MKSRSRQLHRALSVLVGVAFFVGVVGLVAGSATLVGGAVLLIAAIAAFAVLWTNAALRTLVRSLERSISRRADVTETAIIEALSDARRKQSKHEYHHSLALERVERIAADVRGDVEGLAWSAFDRERSPDKTVRSELPRVLFVTSNGAGVGHLTRCAAIARSGQEWFESHILSLSKAAPAVAEIGLASEYFPSRETTGWPWPLWNRQFARRLHSIVERERYDAIVFDGAWIYRGLYEVARRFDVPLVWSARPSWRPTANRTQLENPSVFCDAVIRPGDITGDQEPVGSGVPVYATAPVVYTEAGQYPDRSIASRRLGLDESARHILIQLGGGVINDLADIRAAAVQAVLGLGKDYRAVVARSPLDRAPSLAAPRVDEISTYPLAPWLAAFDACIIAGGYNAVHEAVAAGLPIVVVPNQETVTDDQEWRARSVEEHGWGIAVSEADGIGPALRRLAGSETVFARRPPARFNGASEAAHVVRTIASRSAVWTSGTNRAAGVANDRR